jgi:nesprin-1
LRSADELGLVVMQRSRPDELPAIQEMIDEYQLLWKDIKARIAALKIDCQEEIQKKVSPHTYHAQYSVHIVHLK